MSGRGLTPDLALSWFPVLMRYAGLGIAIYVAVFQDFDRPSLLVLAAGMMGLQSVVEAQRKLADKKRDDKDVA